MNRLLFLLLLSVGYVHADISTSTPLFTWSGPPAGTLSFKLLCDGLNQIGTAIPAGTLTWQAPATAFTPGPHSCYVESVQPTGVLRPVSNTVAFTIPPAVVVVPPVPFVLIVR